MTGSAPRFDRSPHLVDVIADAERLVGALAAVAPGDAAAVREELMAAAAVSSLRLDGSPIDRPPAGAPGVEPDPAEAVTAASGGPSRRGTWLDAMARSLEDRPTEAVTALEYLGVRAALDSDDLAAAILQEPGGVLVELHRRLTRGLLAADQAGQPRASDQAVHDASLGRIIFFPAEPETIPARITSLTGWLVSAGAREHAVVVSGVLHHELLQIHPFEAANGRLARAAARLVLRARGVDPHGLAATDVAIERDAIGYYEEVARTVRRRDLTIWLERWGEAVADGLRLAAERLGVLDVDAPSRAVAFLDGWTGLAFTIADYRAGAAVGPEEARADLHALLDAGRVRRVPGARGLRFTVVPR